MNLWDKMMTGDVDGLMREMEERRFKNMAQVMGVMRDTVQENIRPGLIRWFKSGGVHEPSCGRDKQGDLLRWEPIKAGDKWVRMPTIRADLVQAAVDGKIEVQGMDLLKWIATKLDPLTTKAFIILTRKEMGLEK